jgi:RHS repeat-associated protein
LGQTSTYSYDAINRRTGTTDALGHTTTTGYDAVGNTIQIADALGHQTKYVYDVLNRRIKTIDANNQTTTTGYDFVGNILAITDAVGNTTSYTYDDANRRLTDTNSLGNTRSYGYDAVGDLILSIDRNGRKRTYTYDVLNRQTAERWLDNSGTDIRTFNYAYDAVGHLLDSNDPDSHYRYTYDAVDRVTSVDNLGTAGVPNVLLNYSYDAAGNLLSVADKIGGVQKGTNAYTYDSLNRATRITQSGTGVQGKRVDMSYDAASQMTGLNRYGDLAGTLGVANSSYTYDLVGRLTNLEYKHGTSTLASYGLVYDAANRITQSSGTDGVQDYTYDSTNQLTGAEHTTQTDEAYSYDANGNRISAGYGTGTNNRLLTDGAGSQTHRYLYGTGVDTVLADERGGAVIWALADNQGTIRDIVDGNGTILNHINYDSFGRVVSQTSSTVEFRYGYTGREQDTETGLDYYRARYYDSAVGRFISEDPLGFGAGDTNIYRYVGNSPTNWTDPSGLESCGGEPSWLNRGLGLLRAAGGAFQVSAGVAAAPETGGLSLIVSAKGADDIQAGLRQAWTGRDTNSLTYDAVKNLTGNDTVAGVVDFGTSLVGPGALTAAQRAAAARTLAEAKAIAAEGKALGLEARKLAAESERAAAAAEARAAAAAESGPHPSTPVGRKGSPMDVTPGTNTPLNIGGRDYTGHALDQMQGRGLNSSVVENTIQNGQSIPGKIPGTTAHYDSVNNVTVITDTVSGRVVTAAPGKIKQ